ncbi:hypothetical protein OEZ86_008403 [Tetradesmus obliquus]|nr:hypothetical protein OEZ86_008403 [Tetradesmus obliquus]
MDVDPGGLQLVADGAGHGHADASISDQPAPAGGPVALGSQLQHQQVQQSPTADSTDYAQEQGFPVAPPEDDVWHDASDQWDEADAAAGVPAAAELLQRVFPASLATAAAAAAAAANEAFWANVRVLPHLQQAGYTMDDLKQMWGETMLQALLDQQQPSDAALAQDAAAAAAAGISDGVQEGSTLPDALAGQGFSEQQQRSVRFCGYIKPVLTPAGAGQGRSYQMGAQNGRLLSHLEQRAQATAAAFNRARGFEPPHGNRFKGFSPLLRLYWVRVSSLFVVPFSHAFHLGIFKGLISSMFAKESKQQDGTAAATPTMPGM